MSLEVLKILRQDRNHPSNRNLRWFICVKDYIGKNTCIHYFVSGKRYYTNKSSNDNLAFTSESGHCCFTNKKFRDEYFVEDNGR